MTTGLETFVGKKKMKKRKEKKEKKIKETFVYAACHPATTLVLVHILASRGRCTSYAWHVTVHDSVN